MSGITKILIQRGEDATKTAMNVRFTGLEFSSTSEPIASSYKGEVYIDNKLVPYTNTFFNLKSQADLSFETATSQVVAGSDVEIFVALGDAAQSQEQMWGIVTLNVTSDGELSNMSVFDQTTPPIKVLKNADNYTIQVPPVITKGT